MDDDHQPWRHSDNSLHDEFAMFVEEHLNAVLLPVARRYVGLRRLPDTTAADVVQEALRRTWQVWATRLAGASSAERRAFVCATMSNVAHEEHRSRQRSGEATDPSALKCQVIPLAGPEDRVLARIALSTLPAALAGLPADARMILDLAIAEVPRSQIAVQLGLTTTNVTTKLHRARDRLAQTIGLDVLTELGLRRNADGREGTT